MGGEYVLHLSKLVGIVSLEMTVTSGGRKETMGKYMVTGTIVIETERSTSLLSVGMGSTSDVEAYA